MKVKIKKLNNKAVIPLYAREGDAGMDLTAISVDYDPLTDCITYGTGLAVEIPKGHVGLLFPRSSISNYDLTLANSVGVIDSGYRGEIMFKFHTISVYAESREDINALEEGKFKVYADEYDYLDGVVTDLDVYKIGDRIGQLIIVPYPYIEFEEVEELEESQRGEGGFGSTQE